MSSSPLLMTSLVEVPESRIAPAALLLGQDFTLRNGAATVTSDDADAMSVGTTKAYFLKSGQSIVFDQNGNGKASANGARNHHAQALAASCRSRLPGQRQDGSALDALKSQRIRFSRSPAKIAPPYRTASPAEPA